MYIHKTPAVKFWPHQLNRNNTALQPCGVGWGGGGGGGEREGISTLVNIYNVSNLVFNLPKSQWHWLLFFLVLLPSREYKAAV